MGDQETNDAPDAITAENLVEAIDDDPTVESSDESLNQQELEGFLESISNTFEPLMQSSLVNFTEQMDNAMASMTSSLMPPDISPALFQEISNFPTLESPTLASLDEELLYVHPDIDPVPSGRGTQKPHAESAIDDLAFDAATNQMAGANADIQDSWRQFTTFHDTLAVNLNGSGARVIVTIATITFLYHSYPGWPDYAYLAAGIGLANMLIREWQAQ